MKVHGDVIQPYIVELLRVSPERYRDQDMYVRVMNRLRPLSVAIVALDWDIGTTFNKEDTRRLLRKLTYCITKILRNFDDLGYSSVGEYYSYIKKFFNESDFPSPKYYEAIFTVEPDVIGEVEYLIPPCQVSKRVFDLLYVGKTTLPVYNIKW